MKHIKVCGDFSEKNVITYFKKCRGKVYKSLNDPSFFNTFHIIIASYL